MKVRPYFVSNSSSSSFIFGFKGNTIDDFLNCLKNRLSYFNIYASTFKKSIDINKLFADIKQILSPDYIDEYDCPLYGFGLKDIQEVYNECKRKRDERNEELDKIIGQINILEENELNLTDDQADELWILNNKREDVYEWYIKYSDMVDKLEVMINDLNMTNVVIINVGNEGHIEDFNGQIMRMYRKSLHAEFEDLQIITEDYS